MFQNAAKDCLRRGFAAAHFAKSLTWSAVDLLQAYFLHVILGLSAGQTARLLTVLLLFGAVWNVLVGLLIDALRATRAAVLGLHLAGAGLTAVSLLAQFAVGPRHNVLLLWGLLFRLAYAAYDIPQTAMISLFPADEPEARRYVELRTALSALARLAIVIAGLALGQAPAALFHQGLLVLLACFSGAIVLTAAALAWLGRSAPARRARPRPATALALPRGTGRLLACFALSSALLPILSRVFIFATGPRGEAAFGGWLLLAYTLGNVVGPFVALRIEARWGWRRVWLYAVGSGTISGVALALALAPAGAAWAPPLALLHGLALGCVGALQWEAASRLIRSHALATGQRVDGLVFGLVIFVIQVSLAGAAVVLGAILDAHGRGQPVEILSISLSGAAVAALLWNGTGGPVEAGLIRGRGHASPAAGRGASARGLR